MKKVSLLVLAMSVFAVSQSQIRFGARAGLNVSTIVGKETEGWKSKAGIFIGGLAEIPVLAKFSVQPELFYSMEGAKWDGEDGGKTSLGYIKLPVLAKYTFASGFYGETGPQIGFLLNATDAWDGKKEDVKEFLKKTDFNWVIGAGYYVRPEIGVHVRYNAGLSAFYETEKNSVFQVGVQYIFGRKN